MGFFLLGVLLDGTTTSKTWREEWMVGNGGGGVEASESRWIFEEGVCRELKKARSLSGQSVVDTGSQVAADSG